MGSVISVAMLLLLLAGCTSSGFVRSVERESSLRSDRESEQAVYSDLIGNLLQQKQYYAALAHVEEYQRTAGSDDPRLMLYEARALYGLEYDGQAKAVYLRLLNTPLVGYAHHGLGLIEARNGKLDEALPHFIKAVRARPTDIAMRNDLGFALLRTGKLRDAQLQLSTALELAPENERARTNLMLLMLVSGDQDSAEVLAERTGISNGELSRLRTQADRLRASIQSPSGG